MAISKVKSASITTDAVGSTQIGTDAVGPTQLNEASDYAFTGTVTGAGGVNTPAFEARLSNEPSVSTNTWTKVPVNVEIYDVGGCYDNSTNYRFTPTTAGKYVFYVQVGFNALTDGKYLFAAVRKNGLVIFSDGNAINHTGHDGGLASRYTITAEANGSSDYFEAYAFHNHGSNRNFTAGWTFFGGYKIIE